MKTLEDEQAIMRYNSVRRTLDYRKNHFLTKQLEINKANGNLKAKLFRMKVFNTVFGMKFQAGIPVHDNY
jgi:hypothetical protein